MRKVKSGVQSAGIALAICGVSGVAVAAENYLCRNGAELRRVELKEGARAGGLPCEVLYWRDAVGSGEPQIVWRADFDLDFCVGKTNQMIERMRATGWQCAPATEQAEAVPSAPRPAAARPDDRTLRIAVGRDLRRLEEMVSTYGGRFELTEATLGDLDGDGIADAAVVMRYGAAGQRTGTFLLVYRFRGGTFEPAAKTALPVAGETRLGLTIRDGVIALQGSQAEGRPRPPPMVYALRAGRLIAIADGPADETGVGGPAEPADPDS